jgi:diaminopimelate epimerase
MGTSESERTAGTSKPGEWPEQVAFEKYEGLRNDFILVDERRGALKAPSLPLPARVALCDRHAGVGADGVLTVLAPRSGDSVASMHVTNADGSVPEMCGNGLRCVSRWLVDNGIIPRGARHGVDTGNGVLTCVAKRDLIEVDMRGARVDTSAKPVGIDGTDHEAIAVDVGNPHLVLLAPADRALARRAGPQLEKHKGFPDGCNVGFATLAGDKELNLVVWERGAGLTMACGTGATAAVAALVRTERLPADEDVLVHLPGGDLQIRVSADLQTIKMRGPARRVFGATIDGEALRFPHR